MEKQKINKEVLDTNLNKDDNMKNEKLKKNFWGEWKILIKNLEQKQQNSVRSMDLLQTWKNGITVLIVGRDYANE